MLRKLTALTVTTGGGRFPTPFLTVAALLVFNLAWSTWFVLGNDQSGVIQLLGKHVRTEGPGGIHGKLPFPFETLTTVGTTKVHQMEVGFRTEGDPKDKKYKELIEEAEMFTSDMNLVQIDFTVQYQSSDAAAWTFHVEDPQAVLRQFAESSVRNMVGGSTFDDAVTSGRGAVSAGTAATMQALVDKLGLGAHIGQINLQDAHPPQQVMAAFRDVNGAREDKEKLIQQGFGYYNANIPNARASAKKKIEDATGYKNKRIAEATGEANRFLEVLDKYSQAPEITAQRMRFEALNAILPGKDQVIDLAGKESALLKLFDVGRSTTAAKEKQ
jgi:modulator of FtsH protease HflK